MDDICPQAVPVPAPRRSRVATLLILAGAVCGLMLTLFAFAGFLAFRRVGLLEGQADRTARAFMRSLSVDQPDQAYALASPYLRARVSSSDFVGYAREWRVSLGGFAVGALAHHKWYLSSDGPCEMLVYDLDGNQRHARVGVTLMIARSRMLIAGYRFLP